jgi:hypothetical protein
VLRRRPYDSCICKETNAGERELDELRVNSIEIMDAIEIINEMWPVMPPGSQLRVYNAQVNAAVASEKIVASDAPDKAETETALWEGICAGMGICNGLKPATGAQEGCEKRLTWGLTFVDLGSASG